MQTEQPQADATDLRQYLRVLRRRKWSIAFVTLIVVGAALVFSVRQTRVYTSQARVYVTPIGAGATTAALNLDTERGLADSIAVASFVKANLGLQATPQALLKSLQVTVETNTDILDVSFTDRDPGTAQRVAQGFADGYLEFRQDQAAKQLNAQTAVVQRQIDDVQSQLSTIEGALSRATNPSRRSQLSGQRDVLTARLGALELQLGTIQASAGSQNGGQVVQPAQLPTSPSSPQPVRNGVLALILGLGLGTGVAFLRERLDDHLQGRDDFERSVQAPILAVVPRVGDWRDPDETELVSRVAPNSAPAEAYRTLRTNLQFIGRADDFRVLCVTSPSLGEGKTTTVANLGVVMGQAGRKVVIVSCDLRRPRLHRFFSVGNALGLSSVLSGQADLASSIRRPEPAQNLLILPSGPIPPNPAELLASEDMSELLNELRKVADFVILDTPPLLAVSDALILVPKSDGTLFVADAQATTRGAIRHARQQLDQVGARVVGAVLNDYDSSSARYYGAEGYTYAHANRFEGGLKDQRPASENGKSPLSDRRPADADQRLGFR